MTYPEWMPPAPPKKKMSRGRKVGIGFAVFVGLGIIGNAIPDKDVAAHRATVRANTTSTELDTNNAWGNDNMPDLATMRDGMQEMLADANAYDIDGALAECIALGPVVDRLIDSAPATELGDNVRSGGALIARAVDACEDDDLARAGDLIGQSADYWGAAADELD